ncbi:MAG: protein kinase [Bacteroidaceae bacterium]|nr:protein kinase [Bacteroidaceae bacterium]
MQHDKALAIGTRLQGDKYIYRIEKVLGQGSFGITYKASLSLTGELGSIPTFTTVAIKEFFIHQHNDRDGELVTLTESALFVHYRRKFTHEAKALHKLDHPHIIKVLELFETNNTTYYAMEYCEGGSLDEYISSHQRLSENITLKYFQQIADALSYMHSHHMLHLDLKPANVVLRNNDEAVLIDFGLSKQFDNNGIPESSSTIGGGTPGYAPIEQSTYQPSNNHFPVTMDIYALGATLMKMLTGVTPPQASEIFEDGFPTQSLEKLHISRNTIRCIRKSMTTIYKERFQSVDEFVKALIPNEINNIITPVPSTSGTARPAALRHYENARLLFHNKDYTHAFEQFLKSASLHYNEAQYFTGYCYETGLGTQQSLENARIWYYKASRNGHRKAQERLHELNGESLQEMRREQLTKSNGSIDRKSNNTKSTHNKNNHWINKVKLLIVRLIAIIGCIITLLGIIVLFSILLSNIK